jgi:hypothetical protein
MTPPPEQPQQHYTITSEEIVFLKAIKQVLYLSKEVNSACALSNAISVIEFRPAPSPETIIGHRVKNQGITIFASWNALQEHDAATIAKAREDVLDELTRKLIELVIIDGTTEFVKFPRHAISSAIDSLRTEAQR